MFARRPFPSRWLRGRFGALALALTGLTLSLGLSAPAWAQAENQAAARALFEEGRNLAKAGDYAAACPKFEAANELYTSSGALLNLADCYEHLGRTASAWTQFGEAASVAARAGRSEAAEEARRRQRGLQPKLIRLAIRVSDLVSGLVIARDGIELAQAAWDVSLPVDPGRHAIEARAPGYRSWTHTVELAEPGQTVTVDVPALEPDPTAAAPALAASAGASEPPPAAVDDASKSSSTPKWLLIGGGAALGAGGAVLMLVQSSKASEARENNDPDMYDSTKTPWTIGLVGALVGGASIAAGTVWLLVDRGRPERQEAGVQASPWLASHAGGVTLRGAW